MERRVSPAWIDRRLRLLWPSRLLVQIAGKNPASFKSRHTQEGSKLGCMKIVACLVGKTTLTIQIAKLSVVNNKVVPS